MSRSVKHYSTNTFTDRFGAFRFGGTISLQRLEEMYYRDPISHALCFELVEEAIGKGFNIVDPETKEPVEWNEEAQKIIRQYLPELIRGIAMERRDGKSLVAFMKKGEKLIFRSFSRKYYSIDYDRDGEMIKAEAKSDIDTANSLSNSISGMIPHNFEENDMKNIREILYRRREKVNEGESYLEPIWDILIAIYILASQLAYLMARFGSGIKKVSHTDTENQPVDPVDEDTISNIIENLANYGASDDIVYEPPGLKVDFETATGTTPIREALDVYLVLLSIKTGLPKTKFEGVVPGQQQGAEVNEQSYFDVLRDMQNKFTELIIWFVERLNAFYKWSTEENLDIDIDFNVREEMSEVDQIELDMKRVDYAKSLIDAGMDEVKAFKKAGIEIKKSDLKKPEPIPAQLQQSNGQIGQNEDNGAVLQSPTNNNREITVEND